MAFSLQCNTCELGYSGNPLNDSQCYQAKSIDTVYNYSLPAGQSVFLGVAPTNLVYSDIDVRVTFLLDEGSIDVWTTDDAQAVKVKVGVNWEHVVSLDNGVQPIDEGDVYLFKLQDGENARVVYRSETSDEQVIVLPHSNVRFQVDWHYFMIRAQEDSMLYFYYRQDPPRLNLVVFFGVFLSCFCIASCITVLIWNVAAVVLECRRARRSVQEQQLRSNRPLSNVTVLLHPKDRVCPVKVSSLSGKHAEAISHQGIKEGGADSFALQDLTPHTSALESSADTSVWPIVVQPTRNRCSAISTVLIRLPSGRHKHQATVCMGSALVNDVSNPSGVTKRKKVKKNQLLPQDHSQL